LITEVVSLKDDQLEICDSNIINNVREDISKIETTGMSKYLPNINFNNAYLNGLKEVSNHCLEEGIKEFDKILENPTSKYVLIKHLIFKQIMISLPYFAGRNVTSNSYVFTQVDDLNMAIIGTPNVNPITGGVFHLITEHTNENSSDCVEKSFLFKKEGRIFRISSGIRIKTKELIQYYKTVGVWMGWQLVTRHFDMGDSNLFESLFWRYNRSLIKITDHINLIYKNVWFDHTLGNIDMKDEFGNLIVKDIRIIN